MQVAGKEPFNKIRVRIREAGGKREGGIKHTCRRVNVSVIVYYVYDLKRHFPVVAICR